MASYQVIGYYNTGFNQTNIPDGPNILNLATKKTFPSILHWQDRDLSYIEIQATFNEVADVDYVQVGSSYYFVTDISMESETRCARLNLSLDGLTTCGGIAGIQILSGWADRAHVVNDGLFTNILPEPWQPSEELVIDSAVTLGDDSPLGVSPVVAGGTVDLENVGATAYNFSVPGIEEYVTVPVPKAIETSTTVVLNAGSKNYRANIPNCQLYFLTDPNDPNSIKPELSENLQKLQGLGIVNEVLSCCYQIPASYYDTYDLQPGSESAISEISSVFKEKDSGILYKYVTGINNNKAFALYNTFRLISFCSSDAIDFDGHDICEASSPNSPKFIYFADLSPGGRPFARPKAYKSNTTDIFMQAVSGETWLNTPLLLTGRQGYTQESFTMARQGTFNILGSSAGVASAAFSRPWDIFKETGNFIGTAVDETYRAQALEMSNDVAAPNVMFPRSNSLQNFLGNIFYIIRTRLTDTDIRKFDKFLTMYGYSVNKPLEKTDFTNRQYFNYVKANSVNIECVQGLRTRAIAQSQLENGVRVWHVLPNPIYYGNNPIKTA